MLAQSPGDGPLQEFNKRHHINIGQTLVRHDPVKMVKHKSIRKKPIPGDFYAIQVQSYGWVLLRVIHKDPSLAIGEVESNEDAYLIYLYKNIYKDTPSQPPEPMQPVLMAPPVIVSRLLWTQGYCAFIHHSDLSEKEKLPKHCFWIDDTWMSSENRTPPKFQDEYGNIFLKISRPCGILSLYYPDGIAEILGTSLRDGYDQNCHPLC